MRLPVLTISLMLALQILAAQEKPAELRQEDREAAVFRVKHLKGDAFNRLYNLLQAFGAQNKSDEELGIIVAYAPKHVLNQMRRVIEELDRPDSPIAPGRNIEMTIAFVLCSRQPQATAGSVPPELEPVARQLQAAGLCKDLRLWDAVPIHLREGRTALQTLHLPGIRPGSPDAMVGAYVTVEPQSVTQRESGRYVYFRRFECQLDLPRPEGAVGKPERPTTHLPPRVALSTSGEFKEGQKAVLGKITALEDLTSLFVAVWFRVLD